MREQDNVMLTRVGPDAPMGKLLRRFWLPALLEAEVAAPDCDPVELRLLGEDLVAFRDTAGRVGIVEAYCAHRRACLFFGRNEEGGLRCVYHGWKYDVHGRCIEMPSEPHDVSTVIDHIRITAYPTEVRGGVVWVYMGPSDEPIPAMPAFEWSTLPRLQRTAIKRFAECNWAQAVEGGIDSSHVSFLHRSTSADRSKAVLPGSTAKYSEMDRHPVFDVMAAAHGLWVTARRDAGEGRHYWRVTPFLLPFYTMIPPALDEPHFYGHAWVPIDDENTWTWTFSASPTVPYTEEALEFHGGRDGRFGPLDAHYRHRLNKSNRYGIDRDRQRRGNFTGIEGIPTQDAAITESMGSIVDRTREHLRHSDSGIIQFRRLMLRLASELLAGRVPDAARQGDLYRVRSASVLLPAGTPVLEGAASLLHPFGRPGDECPVPDAGAAHDA